MHYTYVFAGDGCLMEGVASEACSLAGHLKLDRLIVLYDQNSITIDGTTDLAFGEDVAARFSAYGWQVIQTNGHEREAIAAAIEAARADTERPSLICCRTRIAHGAATMEGSNDTHGAPLGDAEIRATKAGLGMDPDATFVVPDAVLAFFREKDAARSAERAAWQARLAAHPEGARLQAFLAAPDLGAVEWPTFAADSKVATRKASGAALQAAARALGNLLGGSADLAGSNNSDIKGGGDIGPDDFGKRNLHFGVREHGMAAICNGMALHGGVLPYCATFLVFHDYMRPSVRLAALMGLPVVYIYTHDSIFLGEDGPTHQPIEHLMAMRGIPNLTVIRPADAAETVEAWKAALARRDGPTALCLTRQNLPVLDRSTLGAVDGTQRGAYVLSEASGGEPAVVLLASGSEVSLALEAQGILEKTGTPARVVSMPSWELFDAQPRDYRRSVLPPGVPRVSVEAGITLGWERYVGTEGRCVGIDRFGASAPGEVVADQLGLNIAAIQEAVAAVLEHR